MPRLTRATRSSIFDVALALAVTAIDLAGSIGEAHPGTHGSAAQVRAITADQPGPAYALVVAGGLALIWRRRWPLLVLTVTVAATAAYAALGYVPGAGLVAVYVALYTVATIESRPVAVVAGAASVVVLFLSTGAASPFGWLGGTNTVMAACSVAALAIGMAVAGRRQFVVSMVERAERAERDREEEARRRVDAERLRIARELHDVVAHSMSMINVQAGVASHVMSSRPDQAVEALTAIKQASREGLRELRAILNVLRRVDEDTEGRAPAPRLSQLDALADVTTQAGLPTTVSVSGHPVALPPTVELAAYRIVQESLTNVLRHAGPTAHATVSVAYEPGRLVVQVDDDGRAGTAPVDGGPHYPDGTGTGISGMRERAGAFGGTLEAGPLAVGGWRVRAVLPAPAVTADTHQPMEAPA
jgi:signal transduction histidine kinase